jgi:hypothetical protein
MKLCFKATWLITAEGVRYFEPRVRGTRTLGIKQKLFINPKRVRQPWNPFRVCRKNQLGLIVKKIFARI